ncbi:hypothetical protein AL536_10605 [Vibrio fluvialis]|uniref:DUF645 domain-containing protein n=1 Tax=Vibrio fluvialis TaxID=676 RepID=A0ABN4KLM0_VIBFL|nr:hypothetical protein AL536_10605 [Vibrio fluvialis]EKO3997786.1 hypothetical protein [Vibrio fluvialis]EKO4008764.1 hypothetical protein [Vibrio fluvialis]
MANVSIDFFFMYSLTQAIFLLLSTKFSSQESTAECCVLAPCDGWIAEMKKVNCLLISLIKDE